MEELLNRREYDRQLGAIDKKLDQHSEQLDGLKQTLASIAVQSVQIQSLQAMQSEMRGDINLVRERVDEVAKFQSMCPKDSVSTLWKVIIGAIVAMAGTFLAHIFTVAK